MNGASVDREELRAAAHRHYQPGISKRQAIVLGYAELTGQPLDPFGFDDAAILLRAERLVLDGVGLGQALAVARAESVTWGVPS